DLGGDGGEARSQVFDVEIAEVVIELLAQPLAVDEPCAREIEVEVAEYSPARQAARETFERMQVSAGMAGTDDGADRGSNDDIGLNSRFRERLNDADVRPAAGRSPSQR